MSPTNGTEDPNGFQKLVKEAHRRSLWQVMIIYLGASWGVLEAADHVIGRFEMPEWAYGAAVLLLLVGFPIVMATAIVQEGMASAAESRRGGSSVPGSPGPSTSADLGAAQQAQASEGSRGGANLSAGTGTIDRVSTRPPRIKRLLTWKNAITGGVVAFAFWGVLAAGWLAMSSWIEGPADPGAAASSSTDELRAIAVLPFENLSADAENAYFADGIHEDVLTQLSKIGALTVISRTSVMPYRETEMSLGEIAGELGVGSVLEGSVRRAGDNVRITAQLIDAKTDEHLWADNFDRALTTANVFSIQSEIAQRIAEALAARLSPEEESRITRVPTADLTAYDRYLRGRDVYQGYTRDGIERSIELFKEALEIDPSYAEAYAGLADAYSQRVQIVGFPLEWADSALMQAQRAIELNPEGASGYKALGLAYSMLGRGAESLQANMAAVERDPNHHGAVNNVGVQEAVFGRYGDALRWYKRGARLDPTAFGPANVAFGYGKLGEADLARAYFDERVDLLENTPILKVFFGMALEVQAGNLEGAQAVVDVYRGQIDDDPFYPVYDAQIKHLRRDFEGAREAAERARSMSPGAALRAFSTVETILGYALIQTGSAQEGRAMLAASQNDLEARVARGADNPQLLWEIGVIEAALGNVEQALNLLERGREAGYQPANGPDVYDPILDPLRDHPGFRAAMETSARELERMRLEIEVEEIANGER